MGGQGEEGRDLTAAVALRLAVALIGVLILVGLAVYQRGRYKGQMQGCEQGLALSRIMLRQELLERGQCPLCARKDSPPTSVL